MLWSRDIRQGIEVLVKDADNPDHPMKKARVVRVYPKPSTWLVVQYEEGGMEQVDESRVTTMFEINRRYLF
jgi:hypothetical protein